MDIEEIERKDGATIRMKSKRGTSVRDEDEVKATVHAETIEEAREESQIAVGVVQERMEELREAQYDADNDNEDN